MQIQNRALNDNEGKNVIQTYLALKTNWLCHPIERRDFNISGESLPHISLIQSYWRAFEHECPA